MVQTLLRTTKEQGAVNLHAERQESVQGNEQVNALVDQCAAAACEQVRLGIEDHLDPEPMTIVGVQPFGDAQPAAP